MAKLTFYHNSGCSESRGSLDILMSEDAHVEIVNYLETPPSESELDQLLTMLGLQPHELVRRGEDRLEELGLDRNPPQTRAEWIRVLAKNPILIERPIVTDGHRAVIGRPPENVRKLIK